MGSFFGGLLAEKGLSVVLIDVWQVVVVVVVVTVTVTMMSRSMWTPSTRMV